MSAAISQPCPYCGVLDLIRLRQFCSGLLDRLSVQCPANSVAVKYAARGDIAKQKLAIDSIWYQRLFS
jgi:hypothetical protein